MNLFTNSLFQTPEDANKDFEKCVVSLSAATTTNLFKQQRQNQEKVITNLSGIEKKYDKLSTNVDTYTNEVKNVVDDYKTQMDGVRQSQNKANDLNRRTTKNIDTYLGTIYDIFTNITKYFKNYT